MSHGAHSNALPATTDCLDGSRVEAKTPEGTRVATPSQNPAIAGAPAAAVAGPSGTATPRTASYAGAVKAPATDWHLEFSLDGKKVALSDTIYGVVHKNRASLPGGLAMGGPYGSAITLTWKKVDGPAPSGELHLRPTISMNRRLTW